VRRVGESVRVIAAVWGNLTLRLLYSVGEAARSVDYGWESRFSGDFGGLGLSGWGWIVWFGLCCFQLMFGNGHLLRGFVIEGVSEEVGV